MGNECKQVSPSHYTWQSAGNPTHPYKEEAINGQCATCGSPTNIGIPLTEIETPSTANHADYFRFGSKHVCCACAWLYAVGKGRPGNYIANGDRMESLVISQESVVIDKRPWLIALNELAEMPPETSITGVMTTDVKPRLWPKTRFATVENFGLYVHAPDYDLSTWLDFSLNDCLAATRLMREPLLAGFSKASIYHGLFRDFARTGRDPTKAMEWERKLAEMRKKSYFIPALIAAGIKQEDKKDVKPVERPASNLDLAAAGGNKPAQAQLGLF